MASREQIRQMAEQFLSCRGIGYTPNQMEDMVSDLMKMANILHLRDNDEVFGFLIICEAYRTLNRYLFQIHGREVKRELEGVKNYFDQLKIKFQGDAHNIAKVIAENMDRLHASASQKIASAAIDSINTAAAKAQKDADANSQKIEQTLHRAKAELVKSQTFGKRLAMITCGIVLAISIIAAGLCFWTYTMGYDSGFSSGYDRASNNLPEE